jgi:hypothetical protein
VGDVKFGLNGEWAQSRVLQVQFQGIKGNDIGQFRDVSTPVVTPAEYKTGDVIYRYASAKWREPGFGMAPVGKSISERIMCAVIAAVGRRP